MVLPSGEVRSTDRRVSSAFFLKLIIQCEGTKSNLPPEAPTLRGRSLVALLIVRPHPDHLDHPPLLLHLIYQPVLDVDPARVGAGEVAQELLVRRRRLVGVLS